MYLDFNDFSILHEDSFSRFSNYEKFENRLIAIVTYAQSTWLVEKSIAKNLDKKNIRELGT